MWCVLAQAAIELAADVPVPDGGNPGGGLGGWLGWWAALHSIGWLLYVPFVIWMASYCVRRDSDARIWLWIILIFHPFGAVIYFVIRFLPSVQLVAPRFLHRFTRGQELRRREIAAAQIGNAHQHVELGDLQRELGQWDRAGASYAHALSKDAGSLPALWGAAQVHFKKKQNVETRDLTRTILDRDFSYKFGDVSLLHARALCELGDVQAARQHLEEHIRRWRHPEALYLLAGLLVDAGDVASARGHLQAMIQDIDASPRAIARKFFFWKGRAKRRLRSLPASP